MILRIYNYVWVKEKVAYYLKANDDKDVVDSCNVLSISTGVPILAIVAFVEQVRGSSEELDHLKKELKQFYKYDKVLIEPDKEL